MKQDAIYEKTFPEHNWNLALVNAEDYYIVYLYECVNHAEETEPDDLFLAIEYENDKAIEVAVALGQMPFEELYQMGWNGKPRYVQNKE